MTSLETQLAEVTRERDALKVAMKATSEQLEAWRHEFFVSAECGAAEGVWCEMERARAAEDTLTARVARLEGALEMVRDADEDCHRDGLSTIPKVARAAIDAALSEKPQ